MFARLGFAVAIHVDADIFLADEVLAVGDRPFKQKCMAQDAGDPRRAAPPSSTSATPPASVRKMCDRVLVLEKGRLGFDGDVDEGIKFLHYDDDDGSDDRTRTTELEDEAPGPSAAWPVARQSRTGPCLGHDLSCHSRSGVSTGNYNVCSYSESVLGAGVTSVKACYSCDSSPALE